jgi:hypothetical protein
MNDSLVKTAIFVRDLLAYNEALIKIGRQGDEITDFTTGYIGVDSLGPAVRLASGERFDPVAESMGYQQQYTEPVILSFYGDGAWARANVFSLLVRSQKSLELQTSLGIGVYQTSAIVDVKILTGQQYGERYEIQINVQYSISVEVATKRIDKEQITVISEKGQEILYVG